MDYINLSASARLFVWDSIPDRFKESFLDRINLLLKRHSHFSIEFLDAEPYETDDEPISMLTAVLDKIITRGNPTLSNKNFEDRILQLDELTQFQFNSLEKMTNKQLVGKGITKFPKRPKPDTLLDEAEELFYSRFSKALLEYQRKVELNSELADLASEEEDAFMKIIGEKVSPGIQCLFDRQSLLSDLIGYEHGDLIGNRVDFSLIYYNLKLIIEIDGEDHRINPEIQHHDEQRDKVLKASGWEVLRIPAKDVRSDIDEWISLLKSKVNASNDKIKSLNSVYLDDRTKSIPFLMITYPLIVQRCLRALIQALRYRQFPLEDHSKILVIEEDIPAVLEAISQFFEYWDQLSTLSSKIPEAPSINIDFIGDEPICPLFSNSKIKTKRVFHPDGKYDFCISHSFTLYTGQEGLLEKGFAPKLEANQHFRIRTSPIVREYRKLQWSPPLNYELSDLNRALVSKRNDEEVEIPENKYEAITYFLQDVFRKHHFWDGQARVISRLLQGEPSIVLLPTGGGKSLTYQFAGLLTPGVTLVIDPLVSLMTDQVENLNLMGFDRAGFISSILTSDQREAELDKIAEGQIYYIFVAPERLQMDEFRNQLKTLVAQYPISLAVIDEVHCVSEWGHDFRPSYLHLGRNIKKYCATEHGISPTLVGLTGTASFAVLTDVQMELNIKDEEAIILPQSFDRKELIFHVEEVDVVEKSSRLKIIKARMPQDFRKNPQTFFQPRGEKTNSGIVFCPHVNGDLGIVAISKISGHHNYFAGKIPKWPARSYDEWKRHKILVQKDFKYNRIQELVATKSFGMGIDKPNIRYTIHYNIPHSVEAFYQEAGRAGRDGKPCSAHCYIIYSDNNWDIANEIIREHDHKKAVTRLNRIRRKDKGDLLVQLWFLFNSYQDREEEMSDTYKLWKKTLYPEVSAMPINATNTVILDFENDNIRVKKEKAIFRLILLGVVEEYSVNWRTRSFEVRIKNVESECVRARLRSYLLQYKFEEFTEYKTAEISVDDVEETVRECIDILIDFIYDEIVEKRKQALRTMAELCRDFKTDKQFRESILAYLQESEFSNTLKQWVNQPFQNIGFKEIYEVLDQVEDLEQSKRLIGTTRRMLDEDPQNIALRFLSCCARSRSSADSDSSVLQECVNLVDQVVNQSEKLSGCVEILLKLLEELHKYRNDLQYKVLEFVLRHTGDIYFARAYLAGKPDHQHVETLNMIYTLIAADILGVVKETKFYSTLTKIGV